MLFKGIVGKFEAFLRAVRPEIAIHAAVHGLAIFVETGAPCVIPEAAPIVLLLEADEFWNFVACFFC